MDANPQRCERCHYDEAVEFAPVGEPLVDGFHFSALCRGCADHLRGVQAKREGGV